MKTVLVSVSDKTGLEDFLKQVEKFDTLRLIATRSTAIFLEEKGFACTKVEDLTKFPEILDGRIKTLHPKVLAGILSRPVEKDRSCLNDLEISEIDLVVVNLYPFEKNLGAKLDDLKMAELIDIGGVTLIRAAAKNFERVSVVCDPNQYANVIEELKAKSGEFSLDLRKRLSCEAFMRTSQYDGVIADYMANNMLKPEQRTQFPQALTLPLAKVQDLRYGENPHQAAAWYTALNVVPFEQLQGKELSTNNLIDMYCLFNILRDLKASLPQYKTACIIKHNNPCGVASDKSLDIAFDRAYARDPMAAFGGIYGFTDKVTGSLAKKVMEQFIEIVAAPDFEPEALAEFSKKKNIRILKLNTAVLEENRVTKRRFRDLQEVGVIIEEEMEGPVHAAQFKCVTKVKATPAELEDMDFTWSVVKHLTSNAIFIASGRNGLGFGIGQTSRIKSMTQALAQAADKSKGSIIASDAFFPATDNIIEAAKAGVKVILQPGGSIKDQDVIDECDKAGIAMYFTGQRCFRH